MSENKVDNLQAVGFRPPENAENFDWIIPHLTVNKGVSKIELVDLSAHGGYSGDAKKVFVDYEDGTKQEYFYKVTFKDRTVLAKQLGLAREAYMYHYFASVLGGSGVRIPSTIFIHGDISTGEKTLILEDLSKNSVQVGYFFGPGSPHNWGKDLAALTTPPFESAVKTTMIDVTKASYTLAARLHSRYWGDKSLFAHRWLRSTDWFQGEGKEAWVIAQKSAADRWNTYKEKINDNTSKVNWNDNLLKCMDSSLSKVNWDVYQEEIAKRPWTLVHGDFHPANFMWQWPAASDYNENNKGEAVMLDFEVVGLGSGSQDIAQFLISHMSHADRRDHYEELLRHYYNELISSSNGKITEESYSWADCLKDYIEGGAQRWIWLMAIMTALCPEPLLQYFQNQVADFLDDHNITPDNIGMPRV